MGEDVVTSEPQRFKFGANWQRFLSKVDESHIGAAQDSLKSLFGESDWSELRFLDIGSGSGLFSLAARRLGAEVLSFDYDAESVACTAEMRRRYSPDDPKWHVERGSILDEPYVRSLGTFDLVYSWGVLHHTGDMWKALAFAALPVKPGGRLCVAIYNRLSPLRHEAIVNLKRTYVRAPVLIQWMLVGSYFAFASSREILAALLHGQAPLARLKRYSQTSRGMSWWHDMIDWAGGYPYEAAEPSEVFDFYHTRGFNLERLRTQLGVGCNEFVFVKVL